MNRKDIDPLVNELQKMYKDNDESLEKAMKLTSEKYQKKRTELKTKLDRLRHEAEEASAAITSDSSSQDMNFFQRSQQMNQIFTDTQREVQSAIDRHKDRFSHMEKMWTPNTNDSSRRTQVMGQELTALKDRQKQAIDEKSRKVSELVENLDRIQRDIDGKQRELKDIDRKETEALQTCEKSAQKDQNEDLDKELQNFLQKTKDLFKR